MYRKRFYGSGLVSRAKRQYKAADQQKDVTTIVVNKNIEFTCGETMLCPDGADPVRRNFIASGTAALNVYDVLRKSEYFNNYCNMYDQVCINSIKVKIIGVNWSSTRIDGINNGTIEEWKTPKSYIVVTAWDRSGLSSNQVKIQENVVRINGRYVPVHDLYVTLGRDITNYSSALTKHLGPGSSYEIVRQLYPNSLAEKEQYVSCSLLKEQYLLPEMDNGLYMYRLYEPAYVIEIDGEGEDEIVEAVEPPKPFEQYTSLPTNLQEDPACRFKPTLLVNVIAGEEPEVVGIDRQNQYAEGRDIRRYLGVNKVKPFYCIVNL